MIIIRFSTGVAVTYNDANFVRYLNNGLGRELYSKERDKGGYWIATVPDDCIIEIERACSVENPVANVSGDAALKHVVANIRLYDGRNHNDLSRLKRALSQYNLNTHRWKKST